MSWIENGIWLKLKTKICYRFDILKNKNRRNWVSL